jgi:hypothetical protein
MTASVSTSRRFVVFSSRKLTGISAIAGSLGRGRRAVKVPSDRRAACAEAELANAVVRSARDTGATTV